MGFPQHAARPRTLLGRSLPKGEWRGSGAAFLVRPRRIVERRMTRGDCLPVAALAHWRQSPSFSLVRARAPPVKIIHSKPYSFCEILLDPICVDCPCYL